MSVANHPDEAGNRILCVTRQTITIVEGRCDVHLCRSDLSSVTHIKKVLKKFGRLKSSSYLCNLFDSNEKKIRILHNFYDMRKRFSLVNTVFNSNIDEDS